MDKQRPLTLVPPLRVWATNDYEGVHRGSEDTEDAFVEAVEEGEIKKGEKTVAVFRYLGPKGGPGEYVPRDIPFSTARCWHGSMGACTTNVTPRPMPFPDSLACFVTFDLRRSFFCFSSSSSAGHLSTASFPFRWRGCVRFSLYRPGNAEFVVLFVV